ncbi:hypothetical protein QEN58_15830 [Halomonas alkaliantarctica]|uniref:ABC transmembrane type-1 domain-containing protein n=1 Tax=Halomonas alkaliantarctica TaxID=232346 RepID=A0ABY8LLS6_9GAMM|nr:hypothetical protein [Halomonas alkaliantarctica]WGI24786.1 hypothetical protein QEN58_15830 [Halomonas alkaliantarctica]
MLPEAIVLRLYGSLIKFIRLSRLVVFSLLIFGTSEKVFDFLLSDFLSASVSKVYDFIKSEFLEGSFLIAAISFVLAFFIIPMINKAVLENFAKREHKFTDALVEKVQQAIVTKSSVLDLHKWKKKSQEGSKSIKHIFFFQELFLGLCFYLFYFFILRSSAVSLLFFILLIFVYLVSSWFFVRKIMIIYITKIYFFNEVVKERNRLGVDQMNNEI